MDRPLWAPTDVDITRPSVARVYDYYLGGSHNFESDREFAQAASTSSPGCRRSCATTATFLRRMVRHLCAEGIDQFLDLGSGIPTEGNVHEVAQAANPHGPGRVRRPRPRRRHAQPPAVGRPTRTPRSPPTSGSPGTSSPWPWTSAAFDLDRPVAILAVAVLHFVSDEERPAELMAEYMRRARPRRLSRDQPGAAGRPSRGRRRERSTTGPAPRTRCTCARARRSLRCSAISSSSSPAWSPRRSGGRIRPTTIPRPATTTPASRAWASTMSARGRMSGSPDVGTAAADRYPDLPTPRQVATAWARAVAGTSFVSMSRAELRAFLEVLAADLIAAFRHGEPDQEVPRRVGGALVASTARSPARSSAPSPFSARSSRRPPPDAPPPPAWLRSRAAWPPVTPPPSSNGPAPSRNASAPRPSPRGRPPSRRAGRARPASARSSRRR